MTVTTSKQKFLGLTSGQLALIVTLVVILIDQIIKIYVKTHYILHEETVITSWFRIVFIENNGMAFGWEFGSKLLLTLFRIVFVGFLIYYMVRLCKDKTVKTGLIVCLSLILAGALGNIIDCMFYGLIFNDPTNAVATLFPPGGGYAPFLQGRVVDMFFFPLFSFYWPSWIPFVGGEYFLFFQPVFNFADASITVGIIVFILFYAKNFKFNLRNEKTPVEQTEHPDNEK